MEIEKVNEEIGRMNGEMRDRKGSSGKVFCFLMIYGLSWLVNEIDGLDELFVFIVDCFEMGYFSLGFSSLVFLFKNNIYS